MRIASPLPNYGHTSCLGQRTDWTENTPPVNGAKKQLSDNWNTAQYLPIHAIVEMIWTDWTLAGSILRWPPHPLAGEMLN